MTNLNINRSLSKSTKPDPIQKKKTIFTRLATGFKLGLNTPTLPDNIIKVQSYPIIRIIRFLGGVSILFILSKRYLNFPIIFLYIAMFFTLIFTIYHIIITFYRIKHIIEVLKSDKLDIRNSPLDRLAQLGARALLCFKGTCESAQPVGLSLGLMLGTDEILKAADREPIFAPFLGGILNTVLPEKVKKDSIVLVKNEIAELESNGEEMRATQVLIKKIEELELKGDLSKEEYKEFHTLIRENNKSLLERNFEIKENI